MPRIVGDHLQQSTVFRILHISAEISALKILVLLMLLLLLFCSYKCGFHSYMYNGVHHSNNKPGPIH